MKKNEIAGFCIDSLMMAEMDKAEVHLGSSRKYELNSEGNELKLLRTIFDTNLNIAAVKDGKKGVISINKTDLQSLTDAVNNVIEITKNSEADTANDISPEQPASSFTRGDMEPALDKMHARLSNFLSQVKDKYPKIKLMESILDFTHKNDYYTNSNGVDLNSAYGNYSFQVMFSANDGDRSSSFNYSVFTTGSLDKDLLDYGSVNLLLKQSVEQLETKPMEGKFTGDVIITPDCIEDMIELYLDVYLRDMALISGTSSLKDKINNQVASPKLTLHSRPVSKEVSGGYFITPDGFAAQDMTILDKGVLKTFMLSLYGANKTSMERALNQGGSYIVEPGDKSFDEIVKSINRGILIARFSGGRPSKNGDFSGVAKNSYYIENGEIKYPVSETMVSGNLYDMFNNIRDISQERVNFGFSILPWISASGITISGK